MNRTLDKRLSAVASLVRQGYVIADIGSDHAHLAVYLVSAGICPRVIATDVREGPLQSAARTVEACGLSDRIALRRTNGLEGLADEGLSGAVVAGMGGELIADILAASPWVREQGLRLVLQPMKDEHILRRRLYAMGYAIECEHAVDAPELYRVYAVMRVLPAPPKVIGEAFAWVGKMPQGGGDAADYVRHQIKRLRTIASGLSRSADQAKRESAAPYVMLADQIERGEVSE